MTRGVGQITRVGVEAQHARFDPKGGVVGGKTKNHHLGFGHFRSEFERADLAVVEP